MTARDAAYSGLVVYSRGGRQLLAVVAYTSIIASGQPGVHRWRYSIRPARLVDGAPAPYIYKMVKNVNGVKHSQLRPFRPEDAATLDSWRF